MKNHEELCLLGVDLLDRFSKRELGKIVLDYTDELVALSYGTLQMMAAGKIPFVRSMIDTAFMLGYEAGKNSKAGDFNPDKWAVAEND